MEVKNNQSFSSQACKVNFKAHRLSTIKTIGQNLGKEAEDTIEIFSLSNKDIPFIKRCIETCKNSCLRIKDNEFNIKSEETPKANFIEILKSFLTQADKSKDMFLIAVKNNKYITGLSHCAVEKTRQLSGSLDFRMDKMLIMNDDKLTKDGLLYGTMTEIAHRSKLEENQALKNVRLHILPIKESLRQDYEKAGYNYGTEPVLNPNYEWFSSPEKFLKDKSGRTVKEDAARADLQDFEDIKNNLKARNENAKFKANVSSKKETLLEDVLELNK